MKINDNDEPVKRDLKDINFPPGFRFVPSDEELILCYLVPKLNNQELPPNRMHVVNLYQKDVLLCDPDKLTEMHLAQGEGIWYFFTSRERKYANGSRPNRVAGSGFWKATGADTKICEIGCEQAVRKSLVFHLGNPSPKGEARKSNWLMQEYRVEPLNKKPNYFEANKRKRKNDDDEASSSHSMKLDEWVLCKIYRGKEEKSKNASTKEHHAKEVQVQPEAVEHGNIVQVDNASAGTEEAMKPEVHNMLIDNNHGPTVNIGLQPLSSNLVSTPLTWMSNHGPGGSGLQSIPPSSNYWSSAGDDTFNMDFDLDMLNSFLDVNLDWGLDPKLQPLVENHVQGTQNVP